MLNFVYLLLFDFNNFMMVSKNLGKKLSDCLNDGISSQKILIYYLVLYFQVAMVEIQIGENIPEALLIAFSICTTLVVAVHLLALMISTCILPNIEAVANMHSSVVVMESPHDKMHWYIELAWMFSTGLGILLFLAEMAILVWVRFYDSVSTKKHDSATNGTVTRSYAAPIASTAIIVPVIVIFLVFAFVFYHKLIAHKYERSTRGLEELENMAQELDYNRGSIPASTPLQNV